MVEIAFVRANVALAPCILSSMVKVVTVEDTVDTAGTVAVTVDTVAVTADMVAVTVDTVVDMADTVVVVWVDWL